MKPIVAAVIAACNFRGICGECAGYGQTTAHSRRLRRSPISPASAKSWRCSRCAISSSGLPARAANWPLADYEIGELQEGFDDVRKLLGGDIVEQHVGAPIAALQKASTPRIAQHLSPLSTISVPAATPATIRSITASS